MCTYQLHNILVTVRRSQMQRSIISPIGSIDPGTSADEQFSEFSMTFLAAPMKRTEPMVIPNERDIHSKPLTVESTLNDNLSECEYKPLIHVMLGVIEPDAHLHSVALAAPLKNILHFSPSSWAPLGCSSFNEKKTKNHDTPTQGKKSREPQVARDCSRRGRAAKNRLRALWERWRTPDRGRHARK